MIIKKYKAQTEQDAILQAKDDLGSGAVVMNVKTIKPKGIFSIFRKTIVEVTAALDENISKDTVKKSNEENNSETEIAKINEYIKTMKEEKTNNSISDIEKNTKTSAIEEKLNSLTQMLENRITEPTKETVVVSDNKTSENKMLELIKGQLIENDVKEEYASMVISEVTDGKNDLVLDDILSSVYQRIVLKLGQIKPIEISSSKPKVIFFMGPTGVGKTTTIAKIASKFKLENKINIGIVTSDTYRIAAVEQIRTYANILSIPIEVIYSANEIGRALSEFKGFDLVLVDTAGRSHKNHEQCQDIKAIIDSAVGFEKENYLVVSATTKYKDLLKIADVYNDIAEYKIIFTKLDETGCFGNILNIKLDTNKELSYATWGQNVPDDIGVMNAQVIAKQLLGGGE